MISHFLKAIFLLAVLLGSIVVAILFLEKNAKFMLPAEQSETGSLRNYDLYISGHTDGPKFSLSINQGFITTSNPNSIVLLAAYPEMEFATASNSDRFFVSNGALSRDALRIFIDIADVDAIDAGYTYRNGNDAGRFALENTILINSSYTRVETNIEIKEFDKVSEYSHSTDQDDDRRLVITHADGRISYVECVITNQCKAYTTWKGELRIIYFYSVDHINDAVDIDSSIISLIDSFNPIKM